MSTQNKSKFEPKEVIFETKKQLQDYVITAFSKVKKLRFNLKGITLTA